MNNKEVQQNHNDLRVIFHGLKVIWKNSVQKIKQWRLDNQIPAFIFWCLFAVVFVISVIGLAVLVFPVCAILTFIVRILQIADIINRWEDIPPAAKNSSESGSKKSKDKK